MNGNSHGWTSPQIVGALVVGALLVAAFVAWELRAQAPMLPMRFFRDRAFSAANGASLFMYFGMFGSIFLLTQFLQTAQGYSPLEAGIRVLPWTAMPIVVAPIAGALSDRIGGRPLMATGLALQAAGLAWIAAVSTPTIGYDALVGAVCPLGNRDGDVLRPGRERRPSAVRREEEGKASGANNAIREVGGVFGVAVLASLFTRYGGYESPATFIDGLVAGDLGRGGGRRGRRARRARHPSQASDGVAAGRRARRRARRATRSRLDAQVTSCNKDSLRVSGRVSSASYTL